MSANDEVEAEEEYKTQVRCIYIYMYISVMKISVRGVQDTG
jgi:hypothetical protein